MRSQEHKDIIAANMSQPFSVEGFLSEEERQELINVYRSNQAKIYKNTGPVTVNVEGDLKDHPIFLNILERLKPYIGDKFEVYTSFFFYVERAHIIHNDDAFNFPLVYKGICLPLEVGYVDQPTGYPHLCFFDQYYLEGPSKFFKGSKEIPTYYNKCVYEYSEVQNKSSVPFPEVIRKEYLSHLQPSWLDELSFNSAQLWKPGNAIIFDTTRLHVASDFLKKGIKYKLGISIFTCLEGPTVKLVK
jgi:hypothetical protein